MPPTIAVSLFSSPKMWSNNKDIVSDLKQKTIQWNKTRFTFTNFIRYKKIADFFNGI